MASQAAIDILIDTYCRNYAVEFFHDMQGNRILHLLNQNSTGGGTVGPPSGYFPTIFVTQADFTTAVDCPLPALAGYNLAIFWNDIPKYLKKGTDWIPFVGGGFTITIAGFDATVQTVNFALTPALV